MPLRWIVELLKKEKVAENIYSFTFASPKGFSFLPGQYVRIFHPYLGESIFRDFTISSSPQDKEKFTLTIKEGISEYKKMLFSLPIGSRLPVQAPMGQFYIDNDEKGSHVFLAGGIGITPFYSMITYAQEENMQMSMTLLVSYTNPEKSLYMQDIRGISTHMQSLKIIVTFTKISPKDWKGENGRISSGMLKKYVPSVVGKTFRIAGSPTFVSDMEDLLIGIGVSLGQIKTDIFLGF